MKISDISTQRDHVYICVRLNSSYFTNQEKKQTWKITYSLQLTLEAHLKNSKVYTILLSLTSVPCFGEQHQLWVLVWNFSTLIFSSQVGRWGEAPGASWKTRDWAVYLGTPLHSILSPLHMLTCSLLSIVIDCLCVSTFFPSPCLQWKVYLHARPFSMLKSFPDFYNTSSYYSPHGIIQASGREVRRLYSKINRIGDENNKCSKLGLRNKIRNQYPIKQKWMKIYFNNIIWTAPFPISSIGFIFKIF